MLVMAQDSDNQHSVVAISNKTDSVHMAETTIHSDFGSYTACICVAGQDIHECHFLAQPLNTCVSFLVTDGVVTESLYDDSYLPEISDCPVLLEPVNATCLDSHSTPNQPGDSQGADSSGLYSYGLFGYHLHSYGLYSYGLCSYGLYSYGLCSYGLYNYDLYSYGLYSYA